MSKSLHSLFLIISFLKLFFTVESITYPGDVKVLKNLKNGLNTSSIAPGSCLSSWDFSADPCDHLFSERFTCGFRCDRVVSGSSRITEITLDPVGYSGSLSSTNWNLPYLQTLDVSDNSFYGAVPETISNLTRIRGLSLSKNFLSGELPSSLGSLTHLQELNLDNNQLQGPIPSSFVGLISLQRLEIQQNNISGELPYLGSLKNLYFLDASDNNITGEFKNLPKSLIELSIRNNELEGTLQQENVREMEFLQVLDLSYNKLSGTVVSSLFDHPSLQQIALSHNNFIFLQVPSNTGSSTSMLIALDLSYNELRGFLPAFMAFMPKLSALSLEHNKFTGMIPSQYALKVAAPGGNTSSFERLFLGGNYLFGPIPGPLMGMKPGSANVSLVDNCLYRCPDEFLFCQGKNQKSLIDCKSFGPVIP